jgi:dTDP-4-dehydrorhamnose reductase
MRDTWSVMLGVHQHAVSLAGVQSEQLSLRTDTDFERAIDSHIPDLVVHAAGLTHVDSCEADVPAAFDANTRIATVVAGVANRRSVPLIHISTDHLFDGTAPFRNEQADPHPLNAYAASKLAAEKSVLQECPSALVLRTNFFAWGSACRQSFSDWVIYGLRSGKELSMFDDVFFTPILADALVGCAQQLLDQGEKGIFNVVGTQRISKYDFGVALADVMQLPGELIRRGSVENAHLRAARPKDMSLSNDRLVKAIGRQPGNLHDWFRQLRLQEETGRREELYNAVTRSSQANA